MDKNQEFINSVEIEDIPWHRIAACYGRATDFPSCFDALQKPTISDIDKAGGHIDDNIEHQSALWPATPFAMIFLARILLSSLPDTIQEANRFRVVNLLDLFINIAKSLETGERLKHADPLPYFEDMLKEEYLWSEEYDEEEDYLRYEDEDGPFPDDLFYSFYFYTNEVLKSCMDELCKHKDSDDEISGKIHQLLALIA